MKPSDSSQPQQKLTIEQQKAMLCSAEGRIFTTGAVIGVIYFMWMGITCLWDPEKAQLLVSMTATHILFGRAAGMSFAYTVSIPPSVIVVVAMLIETTLVFLFYPLFVFCWQRLVIVPMLANFMKRIREKAEEHHQTIRRYGILGLLAFVWFPFWMTGPLVGCVIGFLLGLRPWVNMAVVLGGTYSAIIMWNLILQSLHKKVRLYGPYGPMILLAVILGVIIFGNIIKRRKAEQKEENKKE